MINIELPIQNLAGVGPKMAEKLKRLGIATIRDLLFYFPREWQDFSKSHLIKTLRINEEAIINAKIISIHQSRTFRRHMSITEAELIDDSGKIKAIWFNQIFLAKVLKPGDKYIFAGKIGFDFKTGQKTLAVSQYEKEPIILPVYPETEGLTSKYLRRLIQPLVGRINLVDKIPTEILEAEKLIALTSAINKIHFPKTTTEIEQAKKRLAFDELLMIALTVGQRRKELESLSSVKMEVDSLKLKEFVKSLPFKLTNSQRKVAWEIIQDLTRKIPMNRLLEGDVGSGKTIVAILAAYVSHLNNLQTVWLAPTEILANQHYKNINKLLGNINIKVGLLTGSKKIVDSKRDDIIIGTHALIQKGVSFERLGLIIIDEQHRFGVNQRSHLRKSSSEVPHLLSMTATPIPRTLALSLYGDLDLSVIDEMPPGRKAVKTYAVSPSDRTKAYGFIRRQIENGRQVFVICPLIEEGKLANQLFDLDRKSVVSEYEKLSKTIFPKFKVAMLHGRLKSSEKDKIMKDFSHGKIDILVSTAVIEVGIDIPNATVMMIEGADRFGLAQLHQFRGRVGRGEHQSYCLLFSEAWSEQTKKRLEAMVKSNSGFELAQTDLELRGPGELIGIRQSGLPDLKMASLSDIILVKRTNKIAAEILKEGLEKYPELHHKLAQYQASIHLE